MLVSYQQFTPRVKKKETIGGRQQGEKKSSILLAQCEIMDKLQNIYLDLIYIVIFTKNWKQNNIGAADFKMRRGSER